MTAKSPEAIATYYNDCFTKYGDTAQGAGWPDEADRRTRFGVMAGIAGGDFSGASLCDVACGTGVFLGFLEESRRTPDSYLGIDIDPRAIAVAREKFPKAQFECTDLLTDGSPSLQVFDYVVLNGLFTVRAELDNESMWDFMTSFLERLWPITARGLSFNVMSNVVDWYRDDLFHVSMDRLAHYLFGLAGRHVVFRNDYGLYEYTAYVFREGTEQPIHYHP